MTAIPVTNQNGVALTGLTIGQTYAVWTQAGPWYPTGDSSLPGAYSFDLSPDGVVWSSGIATSFDPWAVSQGVTVSNTYFPAWCSSRQNLDSVHVLITFTATATSVWVRVADAPGQFADNTGALDVEIHGGTLPFCEYGTSVQGPAQAGVIITTGLIDVLLLAVAAPAALAVLFDAFIGKVLFTGDLCAGLPPLMPQFTDADFLGGTGVPNPASLPKFWQGLQAIAWPHFCQCNPGGIGAPPPVVVPPPLVIAPPAAPTGPISIACDNNDICTVLNALMRQLTGMSQSIAQLRSDVTLIQRQGVPFGYLTGPVHSGLTGSGSFAVQGLLGLSVAVTGAPAGWGRSDDNPSRYIPAPASVTLGSAHGVESVLWCNEPVTFAYASGDGAMTLVTWHCKPGVTISITELVREP
jgi:hypothetical protein